MFKEEEIIGKKEEFNIDDFLINPEEKEMNGSIRDLFEKESTENVLIKLGEKGIGKFVVIETEDEKSYIISFPLENYLYSTHGGIKLYIESVIWGLKKISKVKGGGIINKKGDRLIIGGASSQYGKADIDYVKKEIEKAFVGIKVEIEKE